MIVNIFKTAVLHHQKKNFSKAKEVYENILQTSPNDFAVLLNYGTLLSQIKEYEKAEDIFKKCGKISTINNIIKFIFKFIDSQIVI